MQNSSKNDFQIDCDDALVENQNKCVGDNCQTWKCEIVGQGLCSIFKSRFQRHHQLVYEKRYLNTNSPGAAKDLQWILFFP